MANWSLGAEYRFTRFDRDNKLALGGVAGPGRYDADHRDVKF